LISQNCAVWYNTVIRGDLNAVTIYDYTSIGENTTIHTLASVGLGLSAAVSIGKNVIIGSHCSLCSCTIDDECYISPGCTILEGSRLEKGCVIGPGSVVPPGRLIPPGQVWAGNPVEYVRTLNHAEEFANYAFSYSHSEVGGLHKQAFTFTPNGYLLKVATKEDFDIPQEMHNYYALIDDEELMKKWYP